MQPEPSDLRLWTAADLARVLGYSESTVTRMVSMQPDKLPPRVRGLGKPRWLPDVCMAWLRERSTAGVEFPRRPGRPRRKVA